MSLISELFIILSLVALGFFIFIIALIAVTFINRDNIFDGYIVPKKAKLKMRRKK